MKVEHKVDGRPELNFPEGQILVESSKTFKIGLPKHTKIYIYVYNGKKIRQLI